jgi:putative transcriptional regulator
LIEIQLDLLLERRGRTFYWLAKETGMSHSTPWRLKKGKAMGINFITLVKLCHTLGCQPGDVLRLANENNKGKRRSEIRDTKSGWVRLPTGAPGFVRLERFSAARQSPAEFRIDLA